MSATREAVVACARSWLGTRFHHQGRLKKTASHKGGVDCLGLLIGVASELALTSPIQGSAALLSQCDEADYGHLPNGEYLTRRLEELLHGIAPEEAKPGDILLFRFDNNPQHLALVSERDEHGLSIIHAYAEARRVVEHRLDAVWESRLAVAFAII